MTNSTALSAKLRSMGYRPRTSEDARRYGGASVHSSRGAVGGQAWVTVYDGWERHEVDAKASADQISEELKALGYHIDLVSGNAAYASFYVSGSPKSQPKPKPKTDEKFTATALKDVPNTYIVQFARHTVWAVELEEGLDIRDFNPDDLRDNRWSIIGTVTDYQRVEGVHSGWITSVGDNSGEPFRNRDAAMRELRQLLTLRYEKRKDEAFLRRVRELEQGIDEAVKNERLKNLGQLRTVARNLAAEKFFEWKRLSRLSRSARKQGEKLGADWRKAYARSRELDAKANAVWEDMQVCDSMAMYATDMQYEIAERRAS